MLSIFMKSLFAWIYTREMMSCCVTRSFSERSRLLGVISTLLFLSLMQAWEMMSYVIYIYEELIRMNLYKRDDVLCYFFLWYSLPLHMYAITFTMPTPSVVSVRGSIVYLLLWYSLPLHMYVITFTMTTPWVVYLRGSIVYFHV